ncbi:hypothetical protein [Crocosphaera sp. Alani8]|uniref:hypothetical protein n=1 Tax=Crocosphaera sp. Alani8 TaxID=3038952 RepID=UPI00313F05A1
MTNFLLVTDSNQTLFSSNGELIILRKILKKKRRERNRKILYSTQKSLEVYHQLSP